LSVLVPFYVRKQVVSLFQELFNSPVSIGSIESNLLKGKLRVNDVQVKTRDGKDHLLAIEELKAYIVMRYIFDKRLVIEKCIVKNPKLYIVQQKPFEFNISYLFEDIVSKRNHPFANIGIPYFSLENIEITGGLIRYKDMVQENSPVFVMRDLNVIIPQLSNFPKMVKDPVKPKFFARIGQTTVDLAGHSMPFIEGQKSNFVITFNDIPLKNYLHYVRDYLNFDLKSGFMDLQLALSYENKPDNKEFSALQIKAIAKGRELLGVNKGGDEELFFINRILVDISNIIPYEKNMVINKVVMEVPKLRLARSLKGSWNLDHLINYSKSSKELAGKKQDYRVSFNTIVCRVGELTLEASTAEIPVQSKAQEVVIVLGHALFHKGQWIIQNGTFNGRALSIHHNEEPLVEVEALKARLGPINTKAGQAVINAIELERPVVELIRTKDGKTNFSGLLEHVSSNPSFFVFKAVNVHEGSMHYLDKTFSSYFEIFLDQINGQLKDISTQPLAISDFVLDSRLNSLGSLSLQGFLQSDPLAVTFHTRVQEVFVHDLFPIFEHAVNIKPPQGVLSFEMPHVQLTRQSEGVEFMVEGGEFTFKDFNAIRTDDKRKFVAVDALKGSIDQITLNPFLVSLNNVYLSGAGFDLVQTHKGQCGLEGLFKGQEWNKVYEILVSELVFDSTSFSLEDRTDVPGLLFTLENVEGAIQGIHVTEQGTFILGGATSARNLDFSQGDSPLLQSTQVDISAGPLDFVKDKVEVAKVTLKHPDLYLIQNKEGATNLSASLPQWIKSLFTYQSDVKTEIIVDKINFTDGILHYEDHGLAFPFRIDSDHLNGRITRLDNRIANNRTFKVKGRFNHIGDFWAQGQWRGNPFRTKFAIGVKNILMQDIFPLVANQFKILEPQGHMDFDIQTVSIDKLPGQALKVSARGGYAVLRDTRFARRTGQSRKFMNVDELTASFDTFSLSPFALNASKLSLTGLNLDLAKTVNREQNISEIWLTPKNPFSSSISIDELALKDTSVQFKDQSVEPAVFLSLDNIEGIISHINSAKQEPVMVQLMGRLNQDGHVNIQGQVDFFHKEQHLADLQVNLQDVEFSFFAPYIRQHLGLMVNKGKLSLNTNIKIDQGKVQTENDLVISHLSFDEKDKYIKKGDDLSLGLALSLLEDRKGQIKIKVPVSVELNQLYLEKPLKLVRQMASNFIKKAATTPYKYLCKLVNGEPRCSVEIVFNPGSVEILADMEKRLDEVSALLNGDGNLSFVLTGYSVKEEDVDTLKQKKLTEKIKKMHKDDASNPIQALNAGLEFMQKSHTSEQRAGVPLQQYEHYLKMLYDRGIAQKHSKTMWWTEKPDLKRMEEALCQEIEIQEWELKELATSRAIEAKRFLVERKGINAQKIYIESPRIITHNDNLQEQIGGMVIFRLFAE
jgi:uncharacterized protein involved in outer membrane biogenesis